MKIIGIHNEPISKINIKRHELFCDSVKKYLYNNSDSAIMIDKDVNKKDYIKKSFNDVFLKNINDIIKFNFDHGVKTDTMVIYKKVLKRILRENDFDSENKIIELYNNTYPGHKLNKIIVI